MIEVAKVFRATSVKNVPEYLLPIKVLLEEIS